MDKEILEILKRLEEGQKELIEGQKRLESKVESIADQTADLLEFREETTNKLKELNGKIKFQTHKLTETEEEIFGIKNHLQIIK